MAKETALAWLKDKLKETYDKEGKLPLAYTLHLVKQAEQIQKEQIIDSHLRGLIYDLKMDAYDQAKQFYDEKYGGEISPNNTTTPNAQNQ